MKKLKFLGSLIISATLVFSSISSIGVNALPYTLHVIDMDKIMKDQRKISENAHAVSCALNQLYIYQNQYDKLKENGYIDDLGRIKHEDVLKAAKFLDIPVQHLCFMYMGYKPPRFGRITILKDVTEIVFIVDKSGSMGKCKNDTIEDFNYVIDEQKKNTKDDTYITTIMFNGDHNTIHDRAKLDSVKHITNEDYKPEGCTALLDTLGYAINKFSNDCCLKGHKIMFVVLTDGYENASREYGKADIKKLIDAKKEENWKFMFLGANIDSVSEASKIGIGSEMVRNYSTSKDGLKKVYEGISGAILQFRENGNVDLEKIDF